jgi:hypothetical protein
MKRAAIIAMLFLLTIAVAVSAPAQSDVVELLNDQSFWRFHAGWRTPATVADGKYDLGGGYEVTDPPGTRWIRDSFTEPTPPPAAGWREPEFDDSHWPRHLGAPFGGYGYDKSSEVYLLCGRLRFGVADPGRARQVKLNLTYRGGVVVYLNGTEVARGHMPSGQIEPLTLALDYPVEVFFGPNGGPLPSVSEKRGPSADLVKYYEKRFRSLSTVLPAKALRRGTNVLALELHRAALPAKHMSDANRGWNPSVGKNAWGTCGVKSLSLTAPADGRPTANVGAVPDFQIWNCNTLLRPGVDVRCGDPLEPLRPVRLAAPLGGVSSGQLVVSAATELPRVSVAVGNLKSDSGAILGGQNVQIRYATENDDVPNLLDKPPTPARVLPVWLTARVPQDAVSGQYRGTLTITGLNKKASVPVELTVYPCKLPQVRDFGTSVSLLHGPESVARHYDVPLWSDRHFHLLEKSMALLGYAGNTLLSVSAIGEDWFGDQPAIVFRKEGGKYLPDFRFVRRYLELYDKHAGPPRQLCVQVWNYSVSQRGFGRDGGKKKWICKTIKIRLLEGNQLVPAEMPVYTQPGTEVTWAAVADGMKQIVEDLGWDQTRLLWGTGGDNLPTEEIATFFQKIAPDVYWRVATHGSSVRAWGATPEQRTQTGGLILGHGSLVRRNITRRPLVDDCPFEVIKRDGVTSVATDYLTMAPLGRIAAGYSGTAFLTFDCWNVISDDRGRQRSPIGFYVGFGNIHPSGRAFVAPGPNGAAPSPQLEAFREGLQVTEAILDLRAALADPRRSAGADPELADEAKAVIQILMDVMESNRRFRPAGTADVWPHIRRIYELASQVPREKTP